MGSVCLQPGSLPRGREALCFPVSVSTGFLGEVSLDLAFPTISSGVLFSHEWLWRLWIHHTTGVGVLRTVSVQLGALCRTSWWVP